LRGYILPNAEFRYQNKAGMKRALFSFPNLVRKITEPYARSILAFCEKIKPVCRRFGKPFQEFRQPFVFSSQYFRAMGGY